MKAKCKKNIGVFGLIFGFVFLCNPDIAVFDILPDFIGYAIIVSSLANLSDMFYQFDDAKAGFKKGMYISILKLLSILVIFGVFDYSNRSTGMLLFAFIFAVLEIIFLLPAYKKLFEGFLYAAQRIDSHSVFRCGYNDKGHNKYVASCNKKGKAPVIITTRAYRLAVIFVIVKNIMAVAPELTSLINNSQYRFITLLRGFAALIAFAVGIAFIIRMSRYLKAVKRDDVFICGLKKKYENEVMPKTYIFTCRKICLAISVAIFAIALSVNFYHEEINILPGIIFFSLACWFFSIIKSESKASIGGIILSSLGIAVSGIEWALSIIFYTNHFVGEVNKMPHAYREYYTMSAFSVLHTALYVATLVIMLRAIYVLCAKHTGRPKLDDGRVVMNIMHKDDMRSYKGFCIIAIIASVLVSAVYLFNIFASPFSINFWAFEMSQMLDFVASLVFAIYMACALSGIKSDVKSCYSQY